MIMSYIIKAYNKISTLFDIQFDQQKFPDSQKLSFNPHLDDSLTTDVWEILLQQVSKFIKNFQFESPKNNIYFIQHLVDILVNNILEQSTNYAWFSISIELYIT